MGRTDPLPALPYEAWRDSKTALHLFAQIVGKVRMALHPKLNHWWHVTMYVSPRGLTTHTIPYRDKSFEMTFDFVDHQLVVTPSWDKVTSFSLIGLSVAKFHQQLCDVLETLGIEVSILARPYAHAITMPFAEDTEHTYQDADAVQRYWRILTWVYGVFEGFRGEFAGKQTPVHLYWHSFDMAVTRFSGAAAPPYQNGLPSDPEAYSHEVISFGFWPGDDNVPAPAFYSYTYPEPPGLADEPLAPNTATWNVQGGNAMAILMYDDIREAPDPSQALREFMESAYRAGSSRASWEVDALRYAYA